MGERLEEAVNDKHAETASPEAQKCVDFFKLKLAAAHNQLVPDELCEHVQLGAELVGGGIFRAETPIKTVGMCQQCVDWCKSNFNNPQPLFPKENL